MANTNTEQWGNIELPGLPDEVLFKKNWALSGALKAKWADPKYKEWAIKSQIEKKGFLLPEVKLEIYNKCMSVERYTRVFYKAIAREYKITIGTVTSIANNYVGHPTERKIVSDEIHIKNMNKLSKEWEQIKADKKLKIKQKGDKFREEFRNFRYYVYGPGENHIELYDYYNNQRTANQRMPVSPSLIYMFRKNKWTAKQIKEYCWNNNIYKGTDRSYWSKLVNFPYPWFKQGNGEYLEFNTAIECANWINKKFNMNIDDVYIHQMCKSGLQKSGSKAGWIIKKQQLNFK